MLTPKKRATLEKRLFQVMDMLGIPYENAIWFRSLITTRDEEWTNQISAKLVNSHLSCVATLEMLNECPSGSRLWLSVAEKVRDNTMELLKNKELGPADIRHIQQALEHIKMLDLVRGIRAACYLYLTPEDYRKHFAV